MCGGRTAGEQLASREANRTARAARPRRFDQAAAPQGLQRLRPGCVEEGDIGVFEIRTPCAAAVPACRIGAPGDNSEHCQRAGCMTPPHACRIEACRNDARDPVARAAAVTVEHEPSMFDHLPGGRPGAQNGHQIVVRAGEPRWPAAWRWRRCGRCRSSPRSGPPPPDTRRPINTIAAPQASVTATAKRVSARPPSMNQK